MTAPITNKHNIIEASTTKNNGFTKKMKILDLFPQKHPKMVIITLRKLEHFLEQRHNRITNKPRIVAIMDPVILNTFIVKAFRRFFLVIGGSLPDTLVS